jgi:cytochrome P450
MVVGEGIRFSNGVSLDPGEVIGTPVFAAHTDENVYPNGKEFDGFRFSRMREQEGESAKHHASNISRDFLTFGQGHHAWYFHICDEVNQAPDGSSR